MRRGSGIGIIILLVIVLFTSGFSAFGDTISGIGAGIGEIIKGIISIAIRFPAELGITDYINTKVFYLIITGIFAALGIFLTAKVKSKILSICSYIVSGISLLLTLGAN